MFGVFDYFSQFIRKFFHDALPVALAGVIATLLIGQFGSKQSVAPQAVATQQDNGQLVRDAHTAVTEELKRETDARRAADAAQARAFKEEQARVEQAKAEQARIAAIAAEHRAREEARREESRRLAVKREADAKLAAEKAAAEKKAAEAAQLDLEKVAKVIGTPPVAAAPAVQPAPVAAQAPAAPQLPAPVVVATRNTAAPVIAPQPTQPIQLQANDSRREERSGVTGTMRGLAVSAKETAARAWDSVFDISTPPVPPAPIPSGRFSSVD